MTIPSEKSLEVIALGRKAELLYGEFSSYIELAMAKKLRDLKTANKTGKNDAVTLASLLSAYCALDDLKADLERDIKSANLRSKDVYGRSE